MTLDTIEFILGSIFTRKANTVLNDYGDLWDWSDDCNIERRVYEDSSGGKLSYLLCAIGNDPDVLQDPLDDIPEWAYIDHNDPTPCPFCGHEDQRKCYCGELPY